jgi:di/tricarboxylate transporter
MATVGLMSSGHEQRGGHGRAHARSRSEPVTQGPDQPLAPADPLAFGSLLGGMTTLIGTPPNILVSDALRTAGLEPFGLLDFRPVGLHGPARGRVYMVLLGRTAIARSQRLPSGWPAPAGPDLDLVDLYRLGERLFRARIPHSSVSIGQTLAESGLRQDFELSVIALESRGEIQRLARARISS